MHRTTTVRRSPCALDFCQSAIDTIHYALPFLRLNALETRLSFPDTSYKQKTEEADVEAIWRKTDYFLAGYSSAIRSHGQEEVPLYISVMELKNMYSSAFFPLKRGWMLNHSPKGVLCQSTQSCCFLLRNPLWRRGLNRFTFDMKRDNTQRWWSQHQMNSRQTVNKNTSLRRRRLEVMGVGKKGARACTQAIRTHTFCTFKILFTVENWKLSFSFP